MGHSSRKNEGQRSLPGLHAVGGRHYGTAGPHVDDDVPAHRSHPDGLCGGSAAL